MASLISPSSCGFAKVLALEADSWAKENITKNEAESKTKFTSRFLRARYDKYMEYFKESREFEIPFTSFQKKLPVLQQIYKNWSPNKREQLHNFKETFSIEQWTKLTSAKKWEHSLNNCKACYHYHIEELSYFPIRARTFLNAAKINPFHASKELKFKKHKGKPLSDITLRLVNQINTYYQENCEVSFTEALVKANIGVQKKLSPAEMKQQRRERSRMIKNKMQEQWNKNTVERCYGTRQSLSACDKERLSSSFEDSNDAKLRREKQQQEEKEGKRKPKNHCGSFENMTWDKEGLKAEIESYPDDKQINWSELARQFNVKDSKGEIAKNGGQIIKDWLLSQGVNIDRFKLQKRKNETVNSGIRRKKLKILGGDISVPCHQSAIKAREQLKKDIDSGVHNIGELIVPRKYEKLVLRNGALVKKVYYIGGRKIPLRDIREKTLKDHAEFMRINTDEYYNSLSYEQIRQKLTEINEWKEDLNLDEALQKLRLFSRTRHIQMWHDASTLANSGHVAFMVNIMYDPAVYLTKEEYKLKTGKSVNVHTEIETPDLYILARCRSNDEQLAYIETRLNCVLKLSEDLKTSCGVEIYDKLRLFSADGPAVQLEGGQQKGGNYYCLCGVHADYACDIETAYRCTFKSLEERRQMVFNGPVGHRNSMAGKIKPFENLNAAQLMEELMGRGILRKEILKKDTQSRLTEELCGIQRIPSMLITTPGDELDSLNLQDYEIFPHEGMHDVAGHIENLFEELPMHVKDDKHLTTPNDRRCSVKQPVKANDKSKRKVLNIKNRVQSGISKKRNFKGMHAKSNKGKKSELYNKFKQTIELSFDHKEVKRCVDYRKALLRVTHLLRNDLSNDMYMILWTLAEIQEHLYMGEEERCPRNVLRLHNLAFMHNIMLDSVVQMPLTMTNRKFRGKYAHNLVIHAPVQNRIVAGATTHVESKERAFNTAKSITANTSSNRPEHIIGNLLVRLQIEKHKSQTTSTVAREINEISELSRLIEEIPNTFIPYAFIKSNPGKWQAHLERISDFLLPGENIWWEQRMDGVVFHDSKSEPTARSEGPLLHHFRSSNLSAEQIYLRKCWNDCIEKKIPIPTKQFLRELKAEISQSETIVSSANSTSTGIQRAKEETECGIDSDENNEDQEIVLDIQPVHEEDEAENTVPDDVNEGSSETHVSPSEAIEITGRVKVVPCIEINETPPLTSCSDLTNSSLSIKNQHGKDTVSADGNLQDITFIPNVTSTPVATSKKQCRRKPCDAEQHNTSKLGIQSSTIPNYSYNLTTKFGKALSKVLGKSEQVVQYDKYRYMLKTKVADTAFAKEKYLDLVAILHTKVSKTLRELEKTYFINNEVSSEISAENMTEIEKAENAKEIIQKIKYAKAVIHEFETVI